MKQKLLFNISKSTTISLSINFYMLFFVAFTFCTTIATSQTLIADYGLGQNSLNDATGNYADISIGANATTNTVSSCSDNLGNWNTGIKTPSLVTLNRSSFQFDVTVNITTLPTGTNKHNILTFDQSYRDFGLGIDSQGFLYIYYHNGSTSSSSTNTFIAGTDYDIKIQYINGNAKLVVNNSIEIEANLPNPLQGAAANLDNSIFLGDNPGGVYSVEACYSNLKVYNNPPVFTLSTQDHEILPEFKLYPNPVKNQLYITNNKGLDIDQIYIYTLQGKVVKTSRNYENSIDLSKLAEGMYLLKLETKNGESFVKQIIKQ
ncbi:T9SS type A sorting domain-containing protein [Winogradskyella sp.]|uniref:T9SS type A sorting domain-containing protein n=1 Tax=Winogradskyella sp. TaxID=1883156 RepID=UPI003F6C1A19